MVTTRSVIFPGAAASFADITMRVVLKKKKKRPRTNDVSGANNCFVNEQSVGTDLRDVHELNLSAT